MLFSIHCRVCDRSLLVKGEQLGTAARCPGCGTVIQLPAPVPLGPNLKPPPPVKRADVKPESKPLPSFAQNCPACGARLRLLEKYRGVAVQCPDCNEAFVAGSPPKAKAKEDGSG